MTSWVEVMVEPSARARVNSGTTLPVWWPTWASPKGRPWTRNSVESACGGLAEEQARVRVRAARVKRTAREAGAVRVGVLFGVPTRIF